jgi:hypothetical protein
LGCREFVVEVLGVWTPDWVRLTYVDPLVVEKLVEKSEFWGFDQCGSGRPTPNKYQQNFCFSPSKRVNLIQPS